MSPFELLGVTFDADERTIKRAYATQLRHTRPEDDPIGFQQLHTAYQAALEHCRGASLDTTNAAVEAIHLPTEQSAAVALIEVRPITLPAAPKFNFNHFCVAAFELAEAGDPLALHDWLSSQNDLWSLQLKASTGHYLLQQLYQQTPPMPAPCMETLLRFFDLDHVLAGHDPLGLLQLERRTRLAWQLQPVDEVGLQARINLLTPSSNGHMWWIVALLKQSFSWPRAVWIGLYPSNPNLIADFVEELSDKHPEDLPASIDRAQTQFWLDAGDRARVTRARLILGAIRSVAMLLISVGLAPLFSLLYTYHVTLKPMLITIGIFMVPSVLWTLWMAWSALTWWYANSKSLSASGSWLPKSLVPALCAVGLAISVNQHASIGLVLIVPTMWLCLRRFEHFHTSRAGLLSSMCFRFMAIPVAFNLASHPNHEVLSLNLVLAGVAMLAWADDLWKQRARRF